jgi:hypothetical protein
MNVSQSGDPPGKGACLTLAFFRLRISATVSPAEFCTILLSFFYSTPNAGHQARREAGAQRTLYAVACMPLLASLADELLTTG